MRLTTPLGEYLGKLIGNSEELPEETEVRNYRKGSGGYWGEVWLWNVKIGYLKPGGKKGIFVREAPNPANPNAAPAPAPAPVAVAAPPTPIPAIAVTGPTPTPAAPVIIPSVNNPSSVAPPTSNPWTSWLEAPASQPIINPVTGAVTQPEAESSLSSKLIGGAFLLGGGYLLAKALGFKSRL